MVKSVSFRLKSNSEFMTSRFTFTMFLSSGASPSAGKGPSIEFNPERMLTSSVIVF